ncbi:MAG: COR domain-containing protein [Chloroflexota bacterium]
MKKDELLKIIEDAAKSGETRLDLSYYELSELPPEIGQLTNLTKLDLKFNQLSELPPEIGKLTSLTSLNLYTNQLSELPPEIGKLTSLTSLNLSRNQLSELPPEISQLQNLIKLPLSNNQLGELPPEIAQLHSLTRLTLSNNQLSELPPEIAQLPNLTVLSLYNNQLNGLPSEITQLHSLIMLNLENNQLRELPPEIAQLPYLTELSLGYNQLSEFPPEIAQLTSLSELRLNNNQLTSLPLEIGKLSKLSELDLSGNPLVTPPLEVAEQGIEAIQDYFKQLQAGMTKIYEAKLLIVGEPGAGKTTLAQKIKDKNYQLRDEESTEGIDIVPWQFEQDEDSPFDVNIWDFGGQEIYQATHQFFLTKRSLYILLVDDRKEDTDFYYWLNTIELLSDNSPVLIVKNEKQGRQRVIPLRQLRGQFENLKESLDTNLKKNAGLPEIIGHIKHYLAHLPHIGNELPTTWRDVRSALETDKRHYISLETYLDICEQNGISNLDYKLQASEYLHDLGVCLHFKDDPLLNKTVTLKPEWGTDAVYRVLDTKPIRDNFGRFNKADLALIWNDEKYVLMHDELLQLMKRFQLCYPLPGYTDTFIAPQLLSDDQPDYEWDESNNLIIRYQYIFLPKGIITRLIVVLHHYIKNQDTVWKSGVILENEGAEAEVIEFYNQREIKIRVKGNFRRDLLLIINHELENIHRGFEQLQVNRLIPCNCQECRGSQAPYFHRYEILQRRLAHQRYQAECEHSYITVNVRGLLGDVGTRLMPNELDDFADHLFQILQGIIIFEDEDNRNNLLRPFREQPYQQIRRSTAMGIDLRNIVNAVADWGELPGDKLGLVILAEHTLSMVQGTKHEETLQGFIGDMMEFSSLL